jgi:hypothetical protein
MSQRLIPDLPRDWKPPQPDSGRSYEIELITPLFGGGVETRGQRSELSDPRDLDPRPVAVLVAGDGGCPVRDPARLASGSVGHLGQHQAGEPRASSGGDGAADKPVQP